MISSSLRRAGLALAALSFITIRASAFGEIPEGFIVPAQAKTKAQKPAVKAPAAPDAVWQKVLAALKKDGKYKPEAPPMSPGSFSLEDETGDPKADHLKQSVTILGLLNEEEQFEAMGGILTFQEFKLDPKDGNWRIDQWVFEVDVYGEVQNAGHGTLITTPDGKRVSAVPEKLAPGDLKIQAQYDAMLKHWAERKP